MQKETIEGFRLSPQQRHLWGLQQNNPKQIYRVRGAILITGNLDREMLKKALQNVVNRHEILRTSFHCLPGMILPLQAIASTGEVPISEHNLSGLSPEEQEAKIAALFQQLSLFPFDFERGSLWHISLATLAQDNHLLLANFSALIADSVTLKNFTRELSLSYSACACGEEFSDESMQYADIAEWQNELLESEETAIGQEYWRKLHLESLDSLTLPWEKKNSEAEFLPLVERVEIRGDLLNSLEAIAPKHKSDISAFLLTCWQIIIWRLTREQNPIIGVAIDGRKYEELEHTLGLLCKYLPLRCPVQDELNFSQARQQVELNLNEMYNWQEYFSWEEILENEKSSSFWPVCFEFQGEPKNYDNSGVSFSFVRQYACLDPFKLKLSCLRLCNSISAEFHYDSALFSLPKSQVNIVCIDTEIPTVSASYTARASSDNLAYVIYTSGSTGIPKGVAIEHRQLLNYLHSIQEKLNLPADASFATVSTFAADLGNTAIFPALCFGGCLHIISQERATDPEALGEYFCRNPIDCLKIVPSHLAALLNSSQPKSILPGKRLILGGESAHWSLIKTLRNLAPRCSVFNHY